MPPVSPHSFESLGAIQAHRTVALRKIWARKTTTNPLANQDLFEIFSSIFCTAWPTLFCGLTATRLNAR